jgi:hypothetical protein
LAINVALTSTAIPVECDVKEKWNKLLEGGQSLINYLNNNGYSQDRKKLILANLAKLPNSQESEAIRYDRSRGLFHPNAEGYSLLACNVRAAYKGMNSSLACPVSDIAIIANTANGNPISVAPINILPGGKIDINFRGFSPFSSVIFWIHSTPINLGSFIADADGNIVASLPLSDIGSGVHTIIAEGESINGTGVVHQFRVKLPGGPIINSDYGVYLTGFVPDGEPVEINYNGYVLAEKSPDEAGGVFVKVPVFNQERVIITAKDQATGREDTQTFEVSGDIVAPETSAILSGIMGRADCYRGTVAIDLSSVDSAREGVEPSGVQSISYRLDGAPAMIIENAATAISISDEGRHSINYFAQDNAGNIEAEKTLNFIIDNTPPELKFRFDQAKKDLTFTATDNLSADEDIVVIDDGNIIVTDQAGNTTRLNFIEKNRRQALRAQLSQLIYNGQAVNFGGNQLAFAWFYGYVPKMPLTITGWQSLPAIPKSLPENKNITFLLQQARLKNGSFIVASYGNNKTILLEYKNKKFNLKSYSGLKLINFATRKGDLIWSY